MTTPTPSPPPAPAPSALPSSPRKIMDWEFADALKSAGIFDQLELDQISRIVIDVKSGEPVMLYVERFGDERLLNVAFTLDGLEVGASPA